MIVNGDGGEDHKQEFMKVYQKFQHTKNINFSMTGLIDRAGTANDLAGNGGLQFAPPMRWSSKHQSRTYENPPGAKVPGGPPKTFKAVLTE